MLWVQVPLFTQYLNYLKINSMKQKIKYLKNTFLSPVLKVSNPNTPGTRHYKYISKNVLSKNNKLLKPLIFKIQRAYGRSSNTGHITVRGRSRGCKNLYRKLFFFNKSFLGIVLFSLYDPNRTAFVSAVFDFLSYKFVFIPMIHNQCSGSIVGCKEPNYRYFKGFRYQLLHQLNGSVISLLSKNIQPSAKYARAAGTYCQLLFKSQTTCKVRLPSSQIINVSPLCFATLGTVSNIYQRFISVGKAGRNRLRGFRPKVKGIAMNPVDHPHGGRSNGGCCWVTPWGKPFRFRKTSRSSTKKIYKLL
jgi:large subunit ribosomal protein L2